MAAAKYSQCDGISVQQQASKRQAAEEVLRAHTTVRVAVHCVCQEINTCPTTLVTPRTHHATRRWPINTAGATAQIGYCSKTRDARQTFFLSFLVLPLSTYTFHCCIRSHSVGLLWTRDRPFEETSTRQHTTPIRDRHRRHSGIRTRNPMKGEAAAAYLWPRGHRDRRPPVCLSQNHTVATEQKTGKDMAHCCPHTTRHKLSCSSETKAGRP